MIYIARSRAGICLLVDFIRTRAAKFDGSLLFAVTVHACNRQEGELSKILKEVGHGLVKFFAAGVLLALVPAAQGATVGPVTDDIGVIRIAKGAPIQIGAYWVLSGADTALGLDEKRGVEIAFKDVGGKLLDHPLKLNAEDDAATPKAGRPRQPSLPPIRRP